MSLLADVLGIGFIPLRWERYDLMISKDRFFDEGIQRFLSLLHDKAFRQLADATAGYDLQFSGRMVFRGDSDSGEKAS